ncbi:MAG TPA: M57 family metalloprotease [Thermoanaerobaculia bacterium]|nr:M57 family metalloprotease [Thermoanaerobaculia bacterium]
MPTDDEMIARSSTIVQGTVEGSYARRSSLGDIETVYEVRVSRGFKGNVERDQLVSVVSPGGVLGDRAMLVHGAAHFASGEKVLLFLTRSGDALTPVDLTLGKFRFVTSSNGTRLLTRDLEDVVAWDRDGAPHDEPVRREEAFLRFVGDRAANRVPAGDNYLVDASSVVLPPAPRPEKWSVRSDIAPYTSGSYTTNFAAVCNGCPSGPTPMRWLNASAGITFNKNTAQNIAGGTGDGGVAAIQASLAAWTNDCQSNVVLNYGTTANLKNPDDNVNTIVFNDPQGSIAGSFGPGGGTVAVTTSVFWTYDDMFDGLEWWRLLDTDIVFQDGFTASMSGFQTAMTHELGHAIGFRHSNANPASGNDQSVTCSSATSDCTTTATAIMWWQAVHAFGATLQPWDQNAVRAVYPGACVSLGTPSGLTATTNGSVVAVSWAAATGATGYNVYRRAAGAVTFSLVGSTAGTTYNDQAVSSGNAYLYYVKATASGSESAASNQDFATVYTYTDATITAGATTAKKSHIDQLRAAVNAVRALAGLGNATWTTDSTLVSGTTRVKALHIQELRTEVNSARAALGFGAATFSTDGTVTAGATSIKKAHIDQLRDSMK